MKTTHNHYHETEDPLAGDVEPTGGYDESEYVDIRDLEINEDEFGNPVDGHGNLIYPEDAVHGFDDSHEGEEYAGNKLALLLTKTVKDKVGEADYLKAKAVKLVLKDSEGKPSYDLTVNLRHPQPEAGYDFDGSEGFYLAPVDIGKDEYGSDLKYVDGLFGWDYRNDRQDENSFSCTFAGVDPHSYVEAILTEAALESAEVVDISNPKNTKR